MTTSDDPPISFRVAEGEAGARLDKVVVRHLGEGGRRAVAELFARGAVRLNGKRAKKGDRGRVGDVVVVAAGVPIHPEPEASLSVVLETPELVIVNKPAGQPTAPLEGLERGTLAGALLGWYPEMSGVGYRPREPGLIHRLDTQTSGLVVAARSAASFERLRAALTGGEFDKRYLAVVDAAGIPDAGTIDRPLEPDAGDGSRVVIARAADAKPRAVTHYRVVRVLGRWALVEVSVRHAYRHQVRVHLASEGYPIAGDSLYGGPEAPELGARHALHASYVAWAGDVLVPAFEAVAALPLDLALLVGPG